jgi:hypothetical protein
MQQGVTMKPVFTLLLACLLVLAGCQSLSDKESINEPGNENLPASAEGKDRDTVLLSAQHCLSEYLRDQGRVHYGPCLKIISVDDNGVLGIIRPKKT